MIGRLILVVLLLIATAVPVHAFLISPSADDCNVSGNFTGYEKDKAVDGDMTTFWQNDFIGGFFNYSNPGGLGITQIQMSTFPVTIYNSSGVASSQCSGTTGWCNITIPRSTSYLRFEAATGLYYKIIELKVGDGTPNEVTFTGYPTEGHNPLNVGFIARNVTNSSGLEWVFGDGNTDTSGESIVSHTYLNAGTYTVVLNYYDSDGNAGNVTKTNYILIEQQPIYNMSVSPNEVLPNQQVNAVFSSSTGSFGLVDALTVICQYSAGNGGTPCKYMGEDPTFIKSGGTWYQWSNATKSYSISRGAGFPQTLALSGWSSPGSYTVEGTIFQSDDYAPPKMYGHVNVTGQNQYYTVTLNVKDSETQGYISGAIAAIKLPDGSWSNSTVSSGPVSFTVPASSYVGYTASASGYDPIGIAYFQLTQNRAIDVPLSKTKTYGANTTGLRAFVRTGEGHSWVGIEGATVRVEDSTGQTKITPISGMVEFEVETSRTYYVTASKTGYNDVTLGVAVGTEPVSVSLELSRTTVSPTGTVTPEITVCDETGCHVVTASPTLDTRTDAEKDAELADFVRDNAMGLAGFFLLLIVIGGFKMISK